MSGWVGISEGGEVGLIIVDFPGKTMFQNIFLQSLCWRFWGFSAAWVVSMQRWD